MTPTCWWGRRPFLRIAGSIAALSLLAACNTVQGVGRDIESVGRAGKDAMH